MLQECIPQTGQVLPNYPDRRLRRIRIINAWRGRINSSGSLQNFDRIRLDERAYIKN